MSRRLHPLLKMAAMSGADSAVRVQLARGEAVNATDDRGRSALMLAAQRGHASTCRLLLAAGADADMVDSDGHDAVDLAEPGRHTDAILAILEHRARNAGPLHFVAEPPPVYVVDYSIGPDLDISGWEAEAPQVAPPVDFGPVISSMAIQAAISSHHPIDEDADWGDVEVRLPDSRRKPGRPDDLDPVTLDRWRELLAEGLRWGAVPQSRLATACIQDALSFEEAELLLTTVLEEFGVAIEEFEPWSDVGADDVSDGDSFDAEIDGAVEDAMDLLADLRRQRTAVFWAYFNSIPAGRIRRDDEGTLGQAMEAGQAAVLESLVQAPELAQLLDGILRGLPEDPPPGPAGGSPGDDEPAEDDLDEGIALAGEKLAAVVHRRRLRTGLSGALAADDIAAVSAARAVVARLARAVRRQRLSTTWAQKLVTGFTQWHAAWSKMVASNLRLVVHLVQKSWRDGVPVDDLIQEGNTGLMRAVEKYDYRRGTGFGTYAAWWVRARVGRYVSRSSLVRLSSGTAEVRRKVLLARRRLDTGASDASPAMIAQHLGLDEAVVRRALAVSHELAALPDPGDDGEDPAELGDPEAPNPEEDACASELRARLNAHLSRLAVREAHVLQLRFGLVDGDEHTLSEIGKKLGLSRERIRQIESAALEHLRLQADFSELVSAAEHADRADDDA